MEGASPAVGLRIRRRIQRCRSIAAGDHRSYLDNLRLIIDFQVFSGVTLWKISMEETKEILKNNRIEDISWLCSLSESELDMLISIKTLVLRRAKAIGHEELAEKFDLKSIRAIGFVLMEHLKGELRASNVPDLSQSSAFNGCNLLDSNLEKIQSIDEIMASICADRRKKPGKRPREKN